MIYTIEIVKGHKNYREFSMKGKISLKYRIGDSYEYYN